MEKTPIEFEFAPRPLDVVKATYLSFVIKPQKLLIIIFFTMIASYLFLSMNYDSIPFLTILMMSSAETAIIAIVGPFLSLIVNSKFLLQPIKVSFEEKGFRSIRNNTETFYQYSGLEGYKTLGNMIFIMFKVPKRVGWFPQIDDSDALLTLLKKKIPTNG